MMSWRTFAGNEPESRAVRARRTAPLTAVAGILAAGLLLAACGYHLQGHGTGALPPDVKVLAVIPFTNHSLAPHISQDITAAITRELIGRTHYRVQSEPQGADAVLHGDVTGLQTNPVTFDPNTGHATAVEITLTLKIWLVDSRTDRELFRNNQMPFHDQYQISGQTSAFFEEDTLAYQRLSHTVARTVVSDILENF
jgi:outer membrane lipopolysaccharide assembly protein LptE/RlpB